MSYNRWCKWVLRPRIHMNDKQVLMIILILAPHFPSILFIYQCGINISTQSPNIFPINNQLYFHKKEKRKRQWEKLGPSFFIIIISQGWPCVSSGMCVSIFVNYVRQVSLYLWCLELKCLSLIFVSVRLSEWHLPVVYLFNVSYFLGPNVSPMPSETNQYESSHDDVDDEGCVCIVGCHHLCALINSRHFAINKKKNPKE